MNLQLQSLHLFIFYTHLSLSHCTSEKGGCPLWHISRNGQCECGAILNAIVSCDEKFVFILRGNCVTWNNSTNSAEVHRCLFSHWDYNDTCGRYSIPDTYRIPVNISVSKIDHLTCEVYNSMHCIDGYGPAVFSDGISCADCSKHRHLWMLNLLFQLTMVTLMCLAIIPLQIKGTSSPLNIIITYVQLFTFLLKFSGELHTRLLCYVGQSFTSIISTIILYIQGT